jgi:hypothetical protein
MAYIAPTRPWDVMVDLAVPADRKVTVVVVPDGVLQEFSGGTHSFVIPKEQWARVIGLSRDEICQSVKAELK